MQLKLAPNDRDPHEDNRACPQIDIAGAKVKHQAAAFGAKQFSKMVAGGDKAILPSPASFWLGLYTHFLPPSFQEQAITKGTVEQV